MARKSWAELNAIMKRHNVSKLWSWSRVNIYMTSSYSYFLSYIANEQQDYNTSIYGAQGGLAHETIEDFYNKKIEYENMIEKYESDLFDLQIKDLKYDRVNEDKNQTIAYKYETSVKHFFKNHKVINEKMVLEKFIKVDIRGNIFQGYADAVKKDKDGVFHIVDWKTSTIYKGDKAEKESRQLKLYALGLNQAGIPMDKIKICWNFLKYQTITYTQKNKNKKSTTVLRCENWMEKPTLNKNILDNANSLKLDEESIKECISNYDFDSLPNSLKDKYVIDDCYVYIDLTKEKLDSLEDMLYNTIVEIESKTMEYNKNKDDSIFIEKINDKENYFHYNLSGYSRKKHKAWDNYLKEIEMFKDDSEDVDFSL